MPTMEKLHDARMGRAKLTRKEREDAIAGRRQLIKESLTKAFDKNMPTNVWGIHETLKENKGLHDAFLSFSIVPNSERTLGRMVKEIAGTGKQNKKARKALLAALKEAVGPDVRGWHRYYSDITLFKHASVDYIPKKGMWKAQFGK